MNGKSNMKKKKINLRKRKNILNPVIKNPPILLKQIKLIHPVKKKKKLVKTKKLKRRKRDLEKRKLLKPKMKIIIPKNLNQKMNLKIIKK